MPAQAARPQTSPWIFLGLMTLLSLLVYRSALLPSQILFTSDDNIGAMAMRKALLPGGFLRAWEDSVLAGQPGLLNVSWTNLLLWVLPLRLFQNLIHALDLVVASFCLGLFLRERGVRWAAAAVGAMTAFWFGSTFFLTYAGHIGKFGVVMFAALSVWCIECAARRKSAAWAVLGGGAMGAMFIEQADVALFFALILGPYAIFATWRESGFNVREHLRIVLPVAVIALILAFRAIWIAKSFFSLDASADGKQEDRQQVWSYCTQWSWPPEETLEWIAPGYYGWRSGEPEGPYWGRLGRSDGWEQTRQGYPNFKLETLYLGAFPVVLAALALYLAFVLRGITRPDTVFWSVAALLTFVLGLGKFTPIYQLFFALPGMSSIRGPVKFMQATQLALGVLAAFGAEGLFRLASEAVKPNLSAFTRIVWALGGLMLLSASGLGAASSEAAQKVASEGWGAAAQVIVDNRVSALLHGGLLMILAGVWIAALLRVRSVPLLARLAWVASAIMAMDQLVVSGHYVQTVGAEGYIADTAVTDYLKQDKGHQRVFLASQGSFYNQWLSVLFPYHGISTYNVAQIRMPDDYQQFLQAIGQDLPRLWQYFAVGYVIGPAGIWSDLQNNPAFRGRFDLAYAFNVAQQGAGVMVIPASTGRPGQHVIAKHKATADRFALLGDWQGLEPQEIISKLKEPSTQPLSRALVSSDTAAKLPAPGAAGLAGTVAVERYQSGFARMKVSADRPAVLRASDYFSRYWRATVDGLPAEVFRCDHIFTGVFVPAGIHMVELEHLPPLQSLWLQAGGMLMCLAAVAFVLIRKPQAATS